MSNNIYSSLYATDTIHNVLYTYFTHMLNKQYSNISLNTQLFFAAAFCLFARKRQPTTRRRRQRRQIFKKGSYRMVMVVSLLKYIRNTMETGKCKAIGGALYHTRFDREFSGTTHVPF